MRIAEREEWIGEEQNGFRQNRSTTDNLFVLTNIIEIDKKERRKLSLAFIDLKKAFDSVNREINCGQAWNN